MEKTNTKLLALYKEYGTPVSIIIAGLIIASAIEGGNASPSAWNNPSKETSRSAIEEAVLPKAGVRLPVMWGDMGARLVEAGAIDPIAFKQIYQSRGAFPAEYEKLLSGKSDRKLTITEDNAGYLLNLLWAFGLANANPILEDKTEMMNPAYGGAGNFASTGGWTIAKSGAMEHYNIHALVSLTPEQQQLVDRVSRGIFRPCCGNSTHFPDCNHGMAMLGLLELMASQGVSEKEMYKAALAVNSYWFPDTYLTMAQFMQGKGTDWKKVSPQEMLGANYSSAAGIQNILSQTSAPASRGGSSGCGVEAGGGASAPAPRQQSGCGI
ncbi:MAG: hypothetical protein NUV88_01795, partial [Candidatus Kaiserbacteria bacterium]|nr:hypothetical protein [Candidatus Kaiserbacteria bacterium]